MSLMVYDSMAGKKVPFEPLDENKVRMYVCGLTVYDDAHIGHARTYVSFDVIRRYLEYRGLDVEYVQNITDVEDKIIHAAKEAGVDHLDHSRKYTKRAFDDMRAMGIRDPDDLPKVTDHIENIIAMVQKIIDNGYAYEANGSVYFDVQKKEGYGKLSNRDVDEMKAGARVEVSEEKRHPADFALWKAAKEDEPYWESPWGKGRPGWHIECSVMSYHTLGQPFDIHGGGRDLIFPHHENEIAQSEAAQGEDFAKYWMHTGFLNVEGEKMSKSLGNFITIRDLLDKYDPDVVRYFYVLNHYRSPVDFNEVGIKEVKSALERLGRTEERLRKRIAGRHYRAEETLAKKVATHGAERSLLDATESFLTAFRKAMDDDFNTPKAVAAMHDFAGEVRKALDDDEDIHRSLLAWVHEEFVEAAQVLSMFPDRTVGGEEVGAGGKALDDVMKAVLEIREDARKSKQWDVADAIRDKLAAAGVEIQDKDSGPEWRVAS